MRHTMPFLSEVAFVIDSRCWRLSRLNGKSTGIDDHLGQCCCATFISRDRTEERLFREQSTDFNG